VSATESLHDHPFGVTIADDVSARDVPLLEVNDAVRPGARRDVVEGAAA
jgi:hypothetical protein